MTKSYLIIAALIISNLFLGAWVYQSKADYAELLCWACANGNGGEECREL